MIEKCRCHMISVGSYGCGKMETMRRNSGLSHAAFEQRLDETSHLLEEAKKRKEEREKLDRLLWLLYRDDF